MTRILHTMRLSQTLSNQRLLFQGNRVNRDEGNGCIPALDRAIALFLSQASGRSTLFGQSQFYHRSPLRQMLEMDSAQSFLPMIQGLIRPGVGYYTPNQAAGHAGIRVAVTNRQTAMSERLGRPVTRAEAHSSLSSDGGNRRVATQNEHSNRLGRLPMTMSDMAMMGGNRRVAAQNEYSNRLERFPMTLSDAGRIGGNVRAIDDGRELCIIGCGRLQLTATNPLCSICNTEKNKRKKEEDEKSGTMICAECDKDIVGRVVKGCCNPCYQRQHKVTGRVIDPAKQCTHVSVCSNKRYLDGLCQRHHRNRHLDASSASECAAAASAATAPKEKHTSKSRNGKKKAKKRSRWW